MADATARDLGEAGLIDAVVARLPAGPGVLVGPGDDAAVVVAPDGRVVCTTDVLVEGVHFRRDWSSAYDVGRKAAAANLADVAAMGGRPTALLVGLSAPGDLPVDWALGLADGLRDEAALVGASVVGGDTVRGGAVVVSVTALGDLAGRDPVLRAGAVPGDVVLVAGHLSWSALGLQVLATGGPASVDLAVRGLVGERHDECREALGVAVQRHLRPEPHYATGPGLAALGATAMCDVSDGLVVDLLSLCRASGVRVELERQLLERADGDRRRLREALGDEALEAALLHGGEGHALLATLPLAALPQAEALGCHRIGRVVTGDGVAWRAGGELVPAGWEHFA